MSKYITRRQPLELRTWNAEKKQFELSKHGIGEAVEMSQKLGEKLYAKNLATTSEDVEKSNQAAKAGASAGDSVAAGMSGGSTDG